MVFNATFKNISVYIMTVSFIGGGNRFTRRKPLTCCKSLKKTLLYNVVLSTPHLGGIQTHNVSGNGH